MKTKRYWTVLAPLMVIGLIGAVTIGVRAGENEEQVSLDQVPAVVKATILKQAGNGTIKEIERETKDGKTIYEAEVMIGGKEFEIKVAADGTLLGKKLEDDEDHEEEISLDQVPAAAREALLKLAGGARIAKVEREKKHGVVLYEAEWKVTGQEHEATVTCEGALVKLEQVVAAKDVPTAVKSAAAKMFPGVANLKYEKKTIVLYEVEGKVKGKKRELSFSPSGKISRHKKGHDKD